MRTDNSTTHEALIRFLYQAPIGLLQTTPDGEITMINPMSAQLLMPLAADGDLTNLFDVLDPIAPDLRRTAATFMGPDGMICDDRRLTLPARVCGGGGARTLSLSLLKLDSMTLMASLSDVTHAVQQEQQRIATRVRDAARTDALTALPNRTVVVERIAVAIDRARADPDYQFAVMLINCDRFNHVNVTHGTGVGDELLKMMAGRINSSIRSGDALALNGQPHHTTGRLGGDEFVVVLESLRQAEDVHVVAQRLLDALAKPYGIGAHQLHAGASMGVVLRAQTDDDAELVLQFAGIAMRDAKRAGGARYSVFDLAMKERAQRRGTVESDLRRALEERQLYVVYQPIVRLPDQRCVSVEALVRWRHPTRGVVPPIEFIEVAEDTGLIGPIGDFVLQESARQLARWQSALGTDAPQTMSVNVSRAQLAEADLVSRVHHALTVNRLQPRMLQLEITESLAAQDDVIKTRLSELKALGVLIALDDFGTGYSSLACLHQMPVDVVKIDRSFVSQAETSPHHVVLIEATVRVAQSLGMSTVAEGIETAGQAALLARLACDKGQGYLFGRPLPADEATAWLLARCGLDAPPARALSRAG